MPTAITWRAGLDDTDFKAGLQGLATAGVAAMQKLTTASDSTGAAVGKLAEPAGRSEAAMKRLQRQADALRASVDPLAAAEQRLQLEMGKANRLFDAGVISSDLHAKALSTARTRFDEVTAAAKRAAAGQAEHAAAAGLNRNQLLELSHSARASIDAIVAGANPIRVLAMEAPRVAQALGSGEGGMAGGFAAVTRWINPFTIGLTVAGASLVALVAIQQQAEKANTQLANSLIGLGGASGASVGDLNRIAQATAAAGEGSTSFAKSAEAAFVKAGVTMENGNLARVTGMVQAFAAASGQDAPQALEALAAALEHPDEGAKTLGVSIANLSAEQIHHITLLEEQGQHTAAVSALIDGIGGAVQNAKPHLTELGERFANLGGFIQGCIDKLGTFLDRLVHMPAVNKLAELETRRAELVADGKRGNTLSAAGTPYAPGLQIATNVNQAANAGAIADIDKQIASLKTEIAAPARTTALAQSNVASRQRDALHETLNPDGSTIDKLRAQVTGARGFLDADTLIKRGGDPKQLAAVLKGRGMDAAQVSALIGSGGLSSGEADRFRTDIAKGEARIHQLETKGDKKARTPRERKGPADQAENFDNTVTQAGDAAEKDYLGAMRALIVGIDARAQAQKDVVGADLQKQLDTLAHDRARIDASLNDAHRQEQLKALDAAAAIEREAAAAKMVAINREAEAQALEQAARTRADAARYQVDLDGVMLSLATTLSARRDLELKSLADRKAAEDVARRDGYEAQVNPLIDNAQPGVDIAPEIARLTTQYLTAQSQADSIYGLNRKATVRATAGPLETDARAAAESNPYETAEADVASGLRGLGSELVAAARQGQSFGQVIGNTAQKIGDKVFGDLLDKYLTGPLEGWIGSMLPQTAASQTAAIATSTMATAAGSATAALVALAGAAGVASLSQTVGTAVTQPGGPIASLFGGIYRDGGKIPGFARGSRAINGRLHGPGSGTSDSIMALVDGVRPIRVSAGETVVTAAASKAWGATLDWMNRGGMPGFATGGAVGGSASPVSPQRGGGNVIIHDNRTQGEPPPKVQRKANGDTTISLEKMFDKAIRGNPGAVRDAAIGAPPKVTRRGA